jgi:hypothetical protein
MNKKFLIGLGVLVLLLGCAPQKVAEKASAPETALVDEISSSEADVEKLTQDLVLEDSALDAELSRIETLELG